MFIANFAQTSTNFARDVNDKSYPDKPHSKHKTNGHRKAPKSENAYKLLLHKVYMLRKSWNYDFGDF